MLPLLGASNKVRWEVIIKISLTFGLSKFAMPFYRMITAVTVRNISKAILRYKSSTPILIRSWVAII